MLEIWFCWHLSYRPRLLIENYDYKSTNVIIKCFFRYETYDISSRFGIGSDFKEQSSDTRPSDTREDIMKEFVCDLCDVRTISKELLEIHEGGKKHKKRLEQKNRVVPNPGSMYLYF